MVIPPQAIGEKTYSIPMDTVKTQGIAAQDSSPWEIYDREVLDHVYVGVNHQVLSEPEKFFREARGRLKANKHLVVCTKLGVEKIGVTNYSPEAVKELLSRVGKWQIKAEYTEGDEYLLILKKLQGTRGLVPWERPSGPRACVARYGALGDAIMMTPLLRKLREDGYHVTVNISPYCQAVFENNPNIDNIIIQERDLIPNHDLGAYWQMWEREYDVYINLSESIEGDLLAVEGRKEFFTTQPWRQARGDRNYYDYTMVRGGYPEVVGQRGELFFTNAEERRAREFWESLRDNFVVLWALNGSSHHKIFPLMEPMLTEWFRSHPDSRVITVGDTMAQLMEFPHPQLIPKAGKWSIRESLIATKYANLVMGPETMVTNASGCYETPKIVFLSHSTKNALTKYFLNDHSLEPDKSLAQCWPCFQLHYTKESCPLGAIDDMKTGEQLLMSPICSIAIRPEVVLETMEGIYQSWRGGTGDSVRNVD